MDPRHAMHRHRTPALTAALLALICVALGLGGSAAAQEGDFIPENVQLRWERQIRFLESLVEEEPAVPLHHMRLAQAHARLGDEEAVMRNTREAVRLGGNRLAADLLIADFYSEQERFGEAIRIYLKVISASPRQTHALTQAWLLMQRARLVQLDLPIDKAELERKLNAQGFFIASGSPESDSATSKARVKEGNQYLNAGDIRNAIASYEEAASFDPWNADSYRGMGIAYARNGNFEKALGAYHLFIALAPPSDKDVPKVRQIILDYYQKNN
ncbi:MAG: hypothetical protein CMH57_07395 [Myxococcales bacterium]|nr:hypothetical protein [Myxococcales bacterium]